jgi:hypothetical protein
MHSNRQATGLESGAPPSSETEQLRVGCDPLEFDAPSLLEPANRLERRANADALRQHVLEQA